MRSVALLAVLVGCAPFSAPEGIDYTDDSMADRDIDVLRVVTWNIETVGDPGSVEYDAALALLDRIRPDVLALNEIADDTDADRTEWLAIDAGFDHLEIGDAEFGSDRNAILSVFPLENEGPRTADELSGDPAANDLTRDFVVATVQAPGGPVDVVAMHWKSGFDDSDELRRVVESHRAVQTLATDHPTVLTGDWNDDFSDNMDFPARFTRLPSGLPGSYWLGDDLWTKLNGPGLDNDVFSPLLDAGLVLPDIRQRSGTDATRPRSGRRLDYIATTPDVEIRGVEVFDCRDQALPGLELYGSLVSNATCANAADHLPVIADIVVGEVRPTDPVPVDELDPGDLVISELFANPADCPDSTGEWVEVLNTTDAPIALAGLRVVDAAGNSGLVTEGQLEPGALGVLGRGNTPCGADVIATYSAAVSLNNSGDTLTLSAGGPALDSVQYTSGGAQSGSTWSVEEACRSFPTPGEPNLCR